MMTKHWLAVLTGDNYPIVDTYRRFFEYYYFKKDGKCQKWYLKSTVSAKNEQIIYNRRNFLLAVSDINVNFDWR